VEEEVMGVLEGFESPVGREPAEVGPPLLQLLHAPYLNSVLKRFPCRHAEFPPPV
jgi:hypothetical protein